MLVVQLNLGFSMLTFSPWTSATQVDSLKFKTHFLSEMIWEWDSNVDFKIKEPVET